MDKEKLLEMAATLEAERDATIQRVVYLNGKIDALKELAKEQDEAPKVDK